MNPAQTSRTGDKAASSYRRAGYRLPAYRRWGQDDLLHPARLCFERLSAAGFHYNFEQHCLSACSCSVRVLLWVTLLVVVVVVSLLHAIKLNIKLNYSNELTRRATRSSWDLGSSSHRVLLLFLLLHLGGPPSCLLKSTSTSMPMPTPTPTPTPTSVSSSPWACQIWQRSIMQHDCREVMKVNCCEEKLEKDTVTCCLPRIRGYSYPTSPAGFLLCSWTDADDSASNRNDNVAYILPLLPANWI